MTSPPLPLGPAASCSSPPAHRASVTTRLASSWRPSTVAVGCHARGTLFPSGGQASSAAAGADSSRSAPRCSRGPAPPAARARPAPAALRTGPRVRPQGQERRARWQQTEAGARRTLRLAVLLAADVLFDAGGLLVDDVAGQRAEELVPAPAPPCELRVADAWQRAEAGRRGWRAWLQKSIAHGAAREIPGLHDQRLVLFQRCLLLRQGPQPLVL